MMTVALYLFKLENQQSMLTNQPTQFLPHPKQWLRNSTKKSKSKLGTLADWLAAYLLNAPQTHRYKVEAALLFVRGPNKK